MPRIPLTDIALKALKPVAARQMQYWDASLPSFGCRIGQRTKTFNVMLGQQRRLIKIGNYPAMTLAEARRQAHELIGNALGSPLSFTAARDLFFEKHLDTLKPSTAQQQKTLMRRFTFSKALDAITLNDIQSVLDEMPPGSARTYFNVFRTFLNWCVDRGYLARSPLRGKSPYKTVSRDRLLSDPEITAIWQQSRPLGEFGAIVRCLILSGQRLNQFASFDRAWIDGNTLAFPPHIMKANEQHVIPLSSRLQRHLPILDRPYTNLSGAMQDLREALPDIPHFTLHDFRRYFSSTMAKLKVPIDITEQLLAHTSGSRSPIQRVYDRFDRLEPMQAALARYEEHLCRRGLINRDSHGRHAALGSAADRTDREGHFQSYEPATDWPLERRERNPD